MTLPQRLECPVCGVIYNPDIAGQFSFGTCSQECARVAYQTEALRVMGETLGKLFLPIDALAGHVIQYGVNVTSRNI